MKTDNRRKGFTLIELLVVITIVGILAAIGVPRIEGIIAKAKCTEAVVHLTTYERLQGVYFDIYGTFGSLQEIGMDLQDANYFDYSASVEQVAWSVLPSGAQTAAKPTSSSSSDDKVNKDAALDNDGNNGHGNNAGNCDPSNPNADKKGCGTDAATSSSSDEKVNQDAALDNDGNNGHGNNVDNCDPSNPNADKKGCGTDAATSSSSGSSGVVSTVKGATLIATARVRIAADCKVGDGVFVAIGPDGNRERGSGNSGNCAHYMSGF